MPADELTHPRPDPAAGVPVDRILSALGELGFVLSSTGSHVVATRGGERAVVPTHTPEVPAVMVRRLDWSLGASLGHGRLLDGIAVDPGTPTGPPRTTAPPARRTVRAVDAPDEGPSLLLSAVIERLGDAGPWVSFLIEEPAIMGHGPTPSDALVDAQAAAEAWLGAPGGTVEVREVVRR